MEVIKGVTGWLFKKLNNVETRNLWAQNRKQNIWIQEQSASGTVPAQISIQQ